MMHDKYGNTYSLPDEFNQNFLVCGDSGSGKSYFDCRVIEDAVKKGKRVVIPDFSELFRRMTLVKWKNITRLK